MDYCGERGIPFEEFTDPKRWSPLSRDSALAWQARRNSTCGGCGQVKADWMTTGPDGEPTQIIPEPFIVTDHWCPSCDALERHRKAVGDERVAGVSPAFVRVQPAETPRIPEEQ